MTAARASTTCCRACPTAARHAAHHDRLRSVDIDPDELLALFELAVTWHELDYSESSVIGPAGWLTFADSHEWIHPERAAWAFSLAVDIVGRRVAGPPPEPDLATVLNLVRG